VYSGTQNICTLRECTCVYTRVECFCTPDSSFQESFQFRDDSRKLEHLFIANCSRLVFPTQAISAASQLTKIYIQAVKQVEFQPESISVFGLRLLNISHADNVVFHQEALKSFNTDSPTVAVSVQHTHKVVIKPKSFASITSLTLAHIPDLHIEPMALKLKIPTQEPTITIHFRNISTSSVASSAFSSSFRSILIEDSVVDRIETNAFSGILINSITLRNLNINRIERSAFSDQSGIGLLEIANCNISALARKAIVAGISRLRLTGSIIQSISKYGSINATVANVLIANNTFRTLGEESLNLISWNTVEMIDNQIEFLEEGAINAIHSPMDKLDSKFRFAGNSVKFANRNSLVTQLAHEVVVEVDENRFHHECDCNQELYIYTLTGHSGLSSPFQDLSRQFLNSSLCRVGGRAGSCFPAPFVWMQDYEDTICLAETVPDCTLVAVGEGGETALEGEEQGENAFYQDFLLLFQVRTTKGILLFLLFCVLSSVVILTICVGSIWVHRLYKRARLVRDNLSGSFQFNSGGCEEKQILYGSSDHTTMADDEPQYAEIAEIHHSPPGGDHSSSDNVSELEGTTLTDVTTLPKSTTTTLPSMENSTLPLLRGAGERDNLLQQTRQSIRVSMSETSLTDEIMMALRDKLNDPSLYCTVLDAKAGSTSVPQEDLYCSPLYVDPNQLK